MKRIALITSLAWVALCVGLATADVPFEIKGRDVRVVDVDRIIVVKEKATVVAGFPFTVEAPRLDNHLYFWTVPPGVYAVDKGNVLEIRSAPKGSLPVNLKLWNQTTNKIEFAETSVNIGEVEPGPKPDPDPPKPEPEPNPAPINADGLHVMIVIESEDKNKLSKGQFNTIYSVDFREYLKGVCAKDPNYEHAFVIWDKDADVSEAPAKWRDAMNLPRKSVPWLIVSNKAKGGFEGPLPDTTEETRAIIERLK